MLEGKLLIESVRIIELVRCEVASHPINYFAIENALDNLKYMLSTNKHWIEKDVK